jgi:hypothetical protein
MFLTETEPFFYFVRCKMASIKFGGGVIAMSGKIGGTVFARNRAGSYARAWAKPVNPNSTAQGQARNRIGNLTQYWRTTLENAERISWATYANAVAMKNRLGETQFLSGFNHFVRSNAVRLQASKAVVEAGPAVLALAEKDSLLAVSASVATQLLTLVYDVTQPWALEAGAFLHIEMGRPQNSTRNFFGGPWKYAGVINQNVAPTYTVAAPMTLVLGQKVWIAVRICRVDGRVSELMYASCIVAA